MTCVIVNAREHAVVVRRWRRGVGIRAAARATASHERIGPGSSREVGSRDGSGRAP